MVSCDATGVIHALVVSICHRAGSITGLLLQVAEECRQAGAPEVEIFLVSRGLIRWMYCTCSVAGIALMVCALVAILHNCVSSVINLRMVI